MERDHEDTRICLALRHDLDSHFELLVRCYQDRIYRFAAGLCGNLSDAEEITQDTFVRAYQALKRYEPDRIEALALRPWLYRIALNIVRNRTRRRRIITNDLDGEHIIDATLRSPEERVTLAEDLDRVLAVLEAVSRPRRAAVLLRHAAGLSFAEIGDVLGCPESTARSHERRGLREVRDRLRMEET